MVELHGLTQYGTSSHQVYATSHPYGRQFQLREEHRWVGCSFALHDLILHRDLSVPFQLGIYVEVIIRATYQFQQQCATTLKSIGVDELLQREIDILIQHQGFISHLQVHEQEIDRSQPNKEM